MDNPVPCLIVRETERLVLETIEFRYSFYPDRDYDTDVDAGREGVARLGLLTDLPDHMLAFLSELFRNGFSDMESELRCMFRLPFMDVRGLPPAQIKAIFRQEQIIYSFSLFHNEMEEKFALVAGYLKGEAPTPRMIHIEGRAPGLSRNAGRQACAGSGLDEYNLYQGKLEPLSRLGLNRDKDYGRYRIKKGRRK